MLSILVVANSIFQTYVQSLKRDLAKGVFESIALIAVLSWVGLLLASGLLVLGRFEMPNDLMFYVFWFALTSSTIITFTAFLLGMLSTTFFAASSFGNIGFVITGFFAWIFLGETYNSLQIISIMIAALGAFCFFENKISRNYFKENKGLLLMLFSLLLSPLEYILYKSATLHTTTYDQFLSGRLVMDAFFYTSFFILITTFWYKKNPISSIGNIVFSYAGIAFIIGSTLAELFESWLIFKLPAGLFVVLGTVSIPAGYFIGKIKYGEKVEHRYIFGSILIISGVISFILNS